MVTSVLFGDELVLVSRRRKYRNHIHCRLFYSFIGIVETETHIPVFCFLYNYVIIDNELVYFSGKKKQNRRFVENIAEH